MPHAFRKPKVLKRPQEQPIMESQPARPSSGGMRSSVFSPTLVVISSLGGMVRDSSDVSAGMMKRVRIEK